MTIDPKCWVKPLKKSCYFLEENSLEPPEILQEFGIIESFLYLIFTNKLNETALFSCSREGASGMLLLKILDLAHSNQEILKQSKSPICGNYGDFYESLIWILLQLTKILLAAASQKEKHSRNAIIYKLIDFAPHLKSLRPLIAHSYFSLIKSFAIDNRVIRKWLKVNCNFFPAGLDQYLAENKNETLALHLNTVIGSLRENLQENPFVLCQKKLAKIYKNFSKKLSLSNTKDPDQFKIAGFFLMEILDLVSPSEFSLKKKLKFLLEFFDFLLHKNILEVWDFYLLNKRLEKIIEAYPEFQEMVLDQLLVKVMLMHKKEALAIPIKVLPSLLTFVDKVVSQNNLKGRFCNQLDEILSLEDEINCIMKQHSDYTFNLINNQRDDILVKQDIRISLQKFIRYTLQWTCKYLAIIEGEGNVGEILDQINLLLFDPNLFNLLENNDKQAICFFYGNIISVKGFSVIKILYQTITKKFSPFHLGEFKLLAEILSKIDLSTFMKNDHQTEELASRSEKMCDALGLCLIENLKILENDFVLGIKQLVQIFKGFEPAKPILYKFCSDLSSYFKANSEETNSRCILNIISNICQEFVDIFFSFAIEDLDLWTLLIQKIKKAISASQESFLPDLVSINNFLSISFKLLQTRSLVQVWDLFNRLEKNIKSIDINKLCRVNCKTTIQTALQISDIFEFLQIQNNLEKPILSADTIPFVISINALGNKYIQIQERLFGTIKQSPLLQESFFLHLNEFLKIDEKFPIYNQTLIFHAFRDLFQKFWQAPEFTELVEKEVLHSVSRAAVILFKELIKQNLQEMNKEFHLINKTHYLVLMDDITENTTKVMLTSYTNEYHGGERSAQTAEFIASWITLVFKFYNKITPNSKILQDKLKLTKDLLDLLQLGVKINSFSTQQFILNNTLLIQELLSFYETGPFEPSFLNALAFTFDAFASNSISDKFFTEMKLKQTLISKSSSIKLTENSEECHGVKIEKIANDYIVSLGK